MLGLLVAAVVAQPFYSETGFQSEAGIFLGSGAPDFICGTSDNLPDGGWGSHSKYCMIQTHESDAYGGHHGDLTLSTGIRSAGILLGVENSYWGSAFNVFTVDYAGNTFSWGSYYASLNGGGVRNGGSYLGLRGVSTAPLVVPDVLVSTEGAQHHNKGYVFGVEKGENVYAFQVRDDGALFINGQVVTLTTNDTGLQLVQELADGGTRTAAIPWQVQCH